MNENKVISNWVFNNNFKDYFIVCKIFNKEMNIHREFQSLKNIQIYNYLFSNCL